MLVQEALVAHLRRNSCAFSRGKSRHRGVSGHHGRWEARIGQFNGRKNVRNSKYPCHLFFSFTEPQDCQDFQFADLHGLTDLCDRSLSVYTTLKRKPHGNMIVLSSLRRVSAPRQTSHSQTTSRRSSTMKRTLSGGSNGPPAFITLPAAEQ